MSRLIDVDSINGTFAPNETYTGRIVMALLNQMPTAYDVDKVVEELEEEIELVVTQFPLKGKYIKKTRAIEIVKGGGVNE